MLGSFFSALRNNVPLPSSPVARSSTPTGEDNAPLHEKIAQLEEETAAARTTSDQLRSDLATRQAAIDDLEREVQDALQREDAIKTELRTIKNEFEVRHDAFNCSIHTTAVLTVTIMT